MNWKTEILENLTVISKGKKHLETDASDARRYIQIEDLGDKFVPKYTLEKGVDVEENDVIIAWDGANAGRVGVGMTGVIGSTLARIRLVTDKVMGEYLFRFLQSKEAEIRSKRTGATIPHVNGGELRRMELVFPSLVTQQHIIAILDKADGLRKAEAQLLEKYDQLLQSTYLEMFEYSKRKNAKRELVSVESLAEDKRGSIRTGPFGSDLLHSEFVDEGIAVLGIDNAVNNRFEWGQRRFITKKKYDSLSRYTVFPGDIIITIMGTLGRCAVIPEDIPLAINTKHLAAITLDKEKANPYFISYSLHSSPFIQSQLKAKTRGAIMAGLNLSLIKELKIYLPPIELQNHFTAIASNIEQQRGLVLQQQQKSEALCQSLLQRAFKGELC